MEADLKHQPKELKSFFSNDKQRYTFYFDLSTQKTPEKIDVYLQARTVTEEALLIAIQEINARLHSSNIQLVKEISLYKVRLVGRNFKPKTDMPCLSLFQKICDLKIAEFAVQIPNREKAIRQIQPQQPQAPKEEIKELTEATSKLELGEKAEEESVSKP